MKLTPIVAVALLLTACGSSSGSGNDREVAASDYGDEWPLTVESGTLRCDGDSVIFETGGTEYAVNGLADGRGYADIDPIWAPAPEGGGLKLNIGPLLDDGLELCQ